MAVIPSLLVVELLHIVGVFPHDSLNRGIKSIFDQTIRIDENDVEKTEEIRLGCSRQSSSFSCVNISSQKSFQLMRRGDQNVAAIEELNGQVRVSSGLSLASVSGDDVRSLTLA